MPPTTRQIPIADIRIPDVRVTAVYDQELSEQLRSSLTAAGQLVPILVVDTGAGYELVDGLHRLQEAQRRGDTKIEAKIVPGDTLTALLFNLVTNRTRGKVKASEMIRVIDELVHKHEMDSDQIAARTGFTRDYIERLWRIAEADASVRAALDAELIGVGVAFEVSRLPSHLQQEALMQRVAIFHMTTAQVRADVDAVLVEMAKLSAEPPPAPVAPPPPPPPPSCSVCGGTQGPLVEVVLDPRCFGHIQYIHQQQQSAPAPLPRADGVSPA